MDDGTATAPRTAAVARTGVRRVQVPTDVLATGGRWTAVEVVIAPGELRLVNRDGVVWAYPVADMVLVRPTRRPSGGVRVDCVQGDALELAVDDGGILLDHLRREIWDLDKLLLFEGSVAPRHSRVHPSTALLAEAELAVEDALAALDGGGASAATWALVNRRLEHADDLRWEAALVALRAQRIELLAWRARSSDPWAAVTRAEVRGA